MREMYRTILTLKINIEIASTDFPRTVYICISKETYIYFHFTRDI